MTSHDKKNTVEVRLTDLHDPLTVSIITLREVLAHRAEFQEWSTYVAKELDDLSTAVDATVASEAVDRQTIADLTAQLGTAQTSLDAALSGEASAQADVRAALDAAEAAATKLASADAPAPAPDPAPVVDPAPPAV